MKKILITSGDFNNANIWDQGHFSDTPHASSTIILSGAGELFSSVFTAPDLVKQASRVSFVLETFVGAGNITVELQEYNGAAWSTVATGSKSFGSLFAKSINQVAVSVPYTFATLTAGYYRWRFTQSGTSITFRANSGGSLVAVESWDNTHSIPVAGDDVLAISASDGTEKAKITGTQACGSGAGAATNQEYGSFDYGVYCGAMGGIEADQSASSKLELKGHLITAASAYLEVLLSSDYTKEFELEFECVADGDFGITIDNSPEIVNIQGASKTKKVQNYSSGNGTTGNELQVSDDTSDWYVGDLLLFTSTNTYDEVETKYIKTIAGGLITLADTPGGAESGLTYARTTMGYVVNCQTNIKVTAKDPTKGYYFLNDNQNESDAPSITWVSFINPGGSSTSRRGIQIKDAAGRYYGVFNHVICWQPVDVWGFGSRSSRVAETFTGLVQYGGQYHYMASINETYSEPVVVGTTSHGISIVNGNVILENPIVNGFNTVGGIYGGGITVTNAIIECSDPNIQAGRKSTLVFAGCPKGRFTNGNCGDIGGAMDKNIRIGADTYNGVVFDSTMFDGSLDKVDGYEDLVQGSKISFHRYNNQEMHHYVFTASGIKQACGDSLDDTTTYDSGSYCQRLEPIEDSIGLYQDYKILCKVGKSAQIYGRIKKNSTMEPDEVRVELYLPGSSTPDETFYMPSNTDWNVFSLGVAYSGSVPAYATVRVIGLSTSAGAYCYIDSLYDGTDPINGLDTWEDAEPSEIILEQIGDSAAVWAQLTSSMTTTGTIGKLLAKALTLSKFIGLK